MQSYRDSNTTFPPAGPSHAGGSAGMLNGVMRREDEIGKYKDKYEEHMNPFEAFKGRVSVGGFLGVHQLTRRKRRGLYRR
jgi:homeobox protein cut-like